MLARRALEALWREAGLSDAALASVELPGADPILPSSFAVGAAMQASIAASALGAATIWSARGGAVQRVSVDMRHAAADARSERYLRIEGQEPKEVWDRIAGTYRCGDGGWVRLHTNFPNHRDGVLRLLNCDYDRNSVARSLGGWSAQAVEDAMAEAKLVGSRMRSFAEWNAHPHSGFLAAQPVVALEKIGEAPPRVLPPGTARPLAGLRVLELTRVIAGPVSGRTLAAHGADVLHISSPHLPSVGVEDTGRGKRSAHVDLRDPAGRETLRGLLREADVFVQGYRPGGIAAFGFGPEAAAAARPGIVYVSLSAYGHLGPWADRRGFDSLVQTATGFDHAGAEAAGTDGPKPLPAQVLDHASGYLMAFGALAAMIRQTTEGGSWLVRVSLARTGHWLRGLGRIPDGLAIPDTAFADVVDLLERSDSGFGAQIAVRHAGQLERTPPFWERPCVPLGTHPARWA